MNKRPPIDLKQLVDIVKRGTEYEAVLADFEAKIIALEENVRVGVLESGLLLKQAEAENAALRATLATRTELLQQAAPKCATEGCDNIAIWTQIGTIWGGFPYCEEHRHNREHAKWEENTVGRAIVAALEETEP